MEKMPPDAHLREGRQSRAQSVATGVVRPVVQSIGRTRRHQGHDFTSGERRAAAHWRGDVQQARKVGSGVPYHQDIAYFCQPPPDMLTVWIAIDAVTEANGTVA
jgi:ectoine hydroxylase-related dioxygenase (phytanoyl-CoA dioxygenase family)